MNLDYVPVDSSRISTERQIKCHNKRASIRNRASNRENTVCLVKSPRGDSIDNGSNVGLKGFFSCSFLKTI
jgi:hypothetical protein